MATRNYLVFDFGASSGRAVVAKYDGVRFTTETTHRFENRPVFAAGVLYWDILRLYSELTKGIQLSAQTHAPLASLGIDAWGADFGLIDDRGRLMANPVHYRDQQRGKDAANLFEVISAEELFTLTGAPTMPIVDLFELYSMKKHRHPLLGCAANWLAIADLFNYFLTGVVCNEYTRLTTTCLVNQTKKRFEEAIFQKLGLPTDIFPRIVKPGERIGDVSRDVARELGMAPLPVIGVVSHDTPSAVAGVPVAAEDSSWAFISLGTWCVLGQETASPLINRQVYQTSFCNETGAEDRNIIVRSINGLWVIQQCREKWMQELGRDISWEEVVKSALCVKPLTCFVDVDLPEFTQPQPDMPATIREYCRRTGQTVPDGMGRVARCVYESLAMKFRLCVRLLEHFTGAKCDVLHLIGGGTNNRPFCQWIVDATGVPAIAGPTETTSIGNLLMQLKADGQITDLREGRQLCRSSFAVAEFLPADAALWDDAYERYTRTLG